VELERRKTMLAKKLLIGINFLALAGLLFFSYLSTKPSPLFPRTQVNVSHDHPTEITPSDGTFAIWGVIYSLQVAWTIYSLSLNVRKDYGDILPGKFYSYYILSSACNLLWLFAWARVQFGMSLALIFGIALCLVLSVIYASDGLFNYLNQFPSKTGKPNKVDVWCVRILVQNGILFYATWVSIATCINLAVYLEYNLGVDRSKSGTAALAILTSIIILWFVLENFVVLEYTRYIISEYIVLIVALSGVIKAHWTDGHGNQAFALALLILSGVLLVARIALIVVQERKKKAQTQVSFVMKG